MRGRDVAIGTVSVGSQTDDRRQGVQAGRRTGRAVKSLGDSLRDGRGSLQSPQERPLLDGIQSPSDSSIISQDGAFVESGEHFCVNWRSYVYGESRAMAVLAVPVALNTVSRFIIYSVDAAFLGHLGTDELAAATLSEAFFTMTLVILIGCSSALSTFASQAYGAANYRMLGVWFQVALLALTLISVPVIIFNIYSGKVAGLVEKDDHIVDLATTFSRYITIMTLPTCWFSLGRQFFQVQNIVLPGMFVSLFSIPLNIGFNQFFIYGVGSWKGLGFVGSPIASSTTAVVQVVMFFVYTVKIKKYHRLCWDGWTWEAFRWSRLKVFLAVALPMGLTLAFDESTFHALVLMSARLNPDDMAALGIMYQWYNLVFSVWWGIGLAVQVRVGFNLGAQRPAGARCVLYLGTFASLLLAFLVAGLILLNACHLGTLFSSDPKVNRRVAQLAPALACDTVVFVVSSTAGSTLDGMGRVGILFLVTFVTAYCITLPFAYTTTFLADWGAPGLWWAPCFGDSIRMVLLLFFVFLTTNWQREVEKAVTRVEAGAE